MQRQEPGVLVILDRADQVDDLLQFAKRHHLKKRPALSKALDHVGLEFVGLQHRALDDARNAARLLPHVLGIEA